METKHEHVREAVNHVQRAVETAVDRDSFMVAVWSSKDGNVELVSRTTWKFPVGDMPVAAKLLKRSIKDARKQAEALPTANLKAVMGGQMGWTPPDADPPLPPTEE